MLATAMPLAAAMARRPIWPIPADVAAPGLSIVVTVVMLFAFLASEDGIYLLFSRISRYWSKMFSLNIERRYNEYRGRQGFRRCVSRGQSLGSSTAPRDRADGGDPPS